VVGHRSRVTGCAIALRNLPTPAAFSRRRGRSPHCAAFQRTPASPSISIARTRTNGFNEMYGCG